MQNLTNQAHEICQAILQPGDIAIDATAGNGHDTLFLARLVETNGTVYAFDIQKSAIESTSQRLNQAEINNVTLLQINHAQMQNSIPEKHHGQVTAVMFNLGYLPGGDKSMITDSSSTISSIEQSLELLRSGGLLTILAYTGHPGGQEETDAVNKFLDSLCNEQFSIKLITTQEDHISPPQLFVVQKLLNNSD
jgi:predicted methyltransferase